jgi:hypothetical protein
MRSNRNVKEMRESVGELKAAMDIRGKAGGPQGCEARVLAAALPAVINAIADEVEAGGCANDVLQALLALMVHLAGTAALTFQQEGSSPVQRLDVTMAAVRSHAAVRLLQGGMFVRVPFAQGGRA